MEKIPWYQSAIVRQQIVMILVGLVGVFKISTDVDIDATVTAVLAGIAAVVPVFTLVARLIKANPPLTDTAAANEVRVQEELVAAKATEVPAGPSNEAGFVRASMLALLFTFGVVATVVITPGCAAIGVPQPKTFDQKLAYGYASVASTRDAATVYFRGELASAAALPDAEQRRVKEAAIKKDAINVQEQADNARDALDIARSMKDLDMQSADARLASALQILVALQQYLEKNP